MLPENPYLIDTDIFSYILKGKDPVKQTALKSFEEYQFFRISCISYYESLRGLKANPNLGKTLKHFYVLMEDTKIVDLDKKTLDIAANIYADLKQNGNLIGELDILIGATALANNYTLVTNNIKHYQKIQKYTDLKIENWNNP